MVDPMKIEAQIDLILKETSDLTQMSLDTSKRLLDLGFFGPSVVWSVRGVEVFFKNFLLLPHFLKKSGDLEKAQRSANRYFGSGKWKQSVALVNQVFGPLDPMTTLGGHDAMETWIKDVVWARGEVVHGRKECHRKVAEWALEYADQLVRQIKLRLITSEKHPLSENFKRFLLDAKRLSKDVG